MNAEKFLTLLTDNGFDFFSGVPCSYLAPFVRILNNLDQSIHIPAVREDIAVGLAAGAYLSGKLPVVYMQNSGLGYSLEAFASLHLIYSIPTLVVLSYRGPEDDNMEEHRVMGEHTEEILEAFRMKYSLLKSDFTEKRVKEIKQYLIDEKLPYFLLVTRGVLE